MSIDARIVTVSEHSGCIHLMLLPYEGSYDSTTYADRDQLLITSWTRLPLVGQRITGDVGHCIVEGGDGERIVYARQGSFLREQEG